MGNDDPILDSVPAVINVLGFETQGPTAAATTAAAAVLGPLMTHPSPTTAFVPGTASGAAISASVGAAPNSAVPAAAAGPSALSPRPPEVGSSEPQPSFAGISGGSSATTAPFVSGSGGPTAAAAAAIGPTAVVNTAPAPGTIAGGPATPDDLLTIEDFLAEGPDQNLPPGAVHAPYQQPLAPEGFVVDLTYEQLFGEPEPPAFGMGQNAAAPSAMPAAAFLQLEPLSLPGPSAGVTPLQSPGGEAESVWGLSEGAAGLRDLLLEDA